MEIGRRRFLALGAAATAAARVRAQSLAVKRAAKKTGSRPVMEPVQADAIEAAIATLERTGMRDGAARSGALDIVQREIDRMGYCGDWSWLSMLGESTPAAKAEKFRAEYPVLRWLDDSFERVLREFRETMISGPAPAIWYVYNMGIVVKTATCAFSIDLKHRHARRFAPLLDFALVSHNHGDHFSDGFLADMAGAGKPVITNFRLVPGWYCREFDKTFKIKDVTVRCTAADHNKGLPWAVNNYEVACGDGPGAFRLFHSGDCCRADHLKPSAPPDVFFGHCAIGLDFEAAAATTMPAKLIVPLHHQELGHLKGPWRCVAYKDEPLKIVSRLVKNGFDSAMPVWGDRIV